MQVWQICELSGDVPGCSGAQVCFFVIISVTIVWL